MAILTREDILKSDDLRREKVFIPEWKGDVYVRALTAKQRDRFEEQVTSGKKLNMENLRAKFVAMVTVDDKGNQLFRSDEDIKALGQKSARAIERIFTVGQRLNGMTQEDAEELAKNSGTGPKDASS